MGLKADHAQILDCLPDSALTRVTARDRSRDLQPDSARLGPAWMAGQAQPWPGLPMTLSRTVTVGDRDCTG